MQLCGAREPRLDPPHNRNAMTAIGKGFFSINEKQIYLMKIESVSPKLDISRDQCCKDLTIKRSLNHPK